ncbi:MAG: nickel-dependent hydrogenase large subunit [Methanobacteriaceae archaeon]|nr:nickel-dependent hydrogenase large subunit [Methanobacteriaceae archaeon]
MSYIPIGPLHPGIKEPLRIKLKTEGERVVDAEVDLGYMYRGVEQIARGKPWQKVAYLAERVCGICSDTHPRALIEGLERIADCVPPLRAQYSRVIIGELNRIHSHLIANAIYFLALEHETLGIYLLNIREKVMDLLEMISGNRVLYSWNLVGGVRMDFKDSHLKKILENLREVEDHVTRYRKMFKTGPLLGLRSRDIGKLSKEDAIDVRAVGPVARASGVKFDWRTKHPTYVDYFDFEPVWRDECDNYARVMMRFDETLESIKIIRRAVNELPSGPIRKDCDIPRGSIDYRYEAPRGELVYIFETANHGIIKDITIRTPTVPNLEACAKHMFKDSPTISDAVAIYQTIDPCMACTERVVILDENNKKEEFRSFFDVSSRKGSGEKSVDKQTKI